MQPSPSVKARFWAKVHREPGVCWIWKAAKGKNGYGIFNAGGTLYRAHRFAYLLSKGELLPDKVIAHLCDTKLCCNPEHLIQVSQKENLAMVHNLGMNTNLGINARMKLSDEAIAEILQGGKSDRHYARKYGVDHKSIPRLRAAFKISNVK